MTMKWSFYDRENGLIEGLNYGPLLPMGFGEYTPAEDILITAIALWLEESFDEK
jgi:hypothetical protein